MASAELASAAGVPTADAATRDACRYLARAPRSTAEVERHLDARGFDAGAIEAALQALRHLRYIDDEMLAHRRAEELLLRRGCGRLRVVHELTRRGIADGVTRAAVAAVLAEWSETELAHEALRRRFGEPRSLAGAARARAFRFLTARGHPAEIVNDLLGAQD